MGDVSTAAPTGPDGTTAADGYAPVPPGRRDSAGIAPHEETEPIFSDLSRQWQAAGRCVPVQSDEEWEVLTVRYPWL